MKQEKYIIEFGMGAISPQILWPYLATANGLSEWFADTVENDGRHFIFSWNKSPQKAQLIAYRQDLFVRFRWLDNAGYDEKAFFEFRIEKNELTGETILEVIDFATPEEKKESIELWETEIAVLKRRLGI